MNALYARRRQKNVILIALSMAATSLGLLWLALILFSFELQRRLNAAGSGVRSILAHPGVATTTLAAHSRANLINSFRFLVNDPERGALPTLFAATQEIPGNSYVGPAGPGGIRGYPKVGKPSAAGLDARAATELWEATAQLPGVGELLARIARPARTSSDQF